MMKHRGFVLQEVERSFVVISQRTLKQLAFEVYSRKPLLTPGWGETGRFWDSDRTGVPQL